MTSDKPKVPKDSHFNVKQTCQILGICKTTLRKYTEAGWIAHHIQRGTNQKYYLGVDIIAFFENAY